MAKPVWFPTEERKQSSRLYQWMKTLGFESYEEFYQASIEDIGWFWGEADKAVGTEWFEPYQQVVDLSGGIKWPKWFVGGKLNVSHNAVDKWLHDPVHAERTAIIWEREDGEVQRYSYRELAAWVNRVAYGLKKQGIEKGDRIAIYMPMIPETVVAILAIAKIGAILSPSYSGFGADPVAKRLESAQAKMMITADGFLRAGKIVPMKEEADKAIDMVSCVEKVVVVRHLGRDIPWVEGRDINWEQLETVLAIMPSEPMDSMDPFMVIYTSGTTGRPKGAVHTHGGFTLRAAFDTGYIMDLHPGQVHFWVTDMGWIMGPLLVFGSLLNGSTMLLYEGSPVYPGPNRLWKLVEDHQVSLLGISPTLIRSIMQYGEKLADQHDLSSLRSIASTGEPWNPDPWNWLFEKVGKRQVPILNISGGTEIGGIILTNTTLKPISPIGFNASVLGMDAEVYDENGQPVRGQVGELVLRQPWAGMTNGFWQEPDRYEETYWQVWEDTWVHGDAVLREGEDYWEIIGRSDDTMNVAGKRLGPAEIESIIVDHPAVLEAGTIGVPDELKGEVPVCFIVLNEGYQTSPDLINELMDMVSDRLGKSLRPKAIHVVPDLPKTRSAKVMRRVIRSAYLNLDTGDLSSLENPQTISPIQEIGERNRVN